MHFCCLLCPDTAVRLDDVAAGPTPSGTVICARCWSAETGTQRELDIDLRVTVRAIVRGVARELGLEDAQCVACGQLVGLDPLALLVHPAGWFCAACRETSLARALIADEGLAPMLTAAKNYRCVVCEQMSDTYSYSLNPLDLTICRSCQSTKLGTQLGQDEAFRQRFIEALGLNKKPWPSPQPSDQGYCG